MKRRCRRTFAQIRVEQNADIAKYISHHADKLDAADQREAGAIVRALGGSIKAGLAE